MKKFLKNPPFLPQRKNGKFYNHFPEEKQESPEWLLPSIKMYIKGRQLRQKHTPDLDGWLEPYKGYKNAEEPIITWLGHASMLIQMGGLNILADPIFDKPSFLYPRVLPFGAKEHELPKIDIVVLSHNHRDHMDEKTLKLLYKNHDPLFLVPEGDKFWFLKRNMPKVEEFMWWETLEVGGVDITFVPAWHWSQRGLFDHNTSLWGGWVFKVKDHTVFFAGDTAYSQEYFKAIGEVFPHIDVAIMPAGPCDPDEMMRKSHMNAEEAGQAFLDCKARYFIPMHWGTFYFGTDLFDTPIARLKDWWLLNQDHLSERSLCLCKVGQHFHLELHKNSCSNMPDQNR